MKKYTREEVLKSALEYFNGEELPANVWINKYALKDSDGNIYEKDPNDMHRRIAKEIARIESKYKNPISEEKIFETIKDFKYIIPQGSPMAGIGNDFQVSSLSNCFVVGPQKTKGKYEDSYGSILRTDQEIIQLCKRRAGVGTTLEYIRPTGSPVKNAALTSTGVVPFMERFSNSIREVAQSGRRGALMLTTHVKSMDSEDFLSAKLDTKKVTGANISVKIDDEFMVALEKGEKYTQQFPIDSDNPEMTKEVDPKKIWDKLIENNYNSAEPGLLFWDNIIRESVADAYKEEGFESIGTNPCSELVLCDGDSCRLLLLNLFSFVKNPFTDKSYFDFDLFKEHVIYAQRYMDDIVDLELEQITKILNKIESDPECEDTKKIEKDLWEKLYQKCDLGRRTGTGVTGEGDMLAALGLKYGTKEATIFSIKVHEKMALDCYRTSVELAKERGAFDIFKYEKEKDRVFLRRLYELDPQLEEDMKKYGRRNIAILTISPAGTTSLMTQTTSGIEPLFLPYYKRRRKVNPNDKDVNISFVDEVGDSWEEYAVFHPRFLQWAEINGINISKDSSEEELEEAYKKSPYYNATSNDIDWLESVKMLGGIQKYVDHSISKTINLPADTTISTVDELYREAYKSGCKGVTIYRDGSRSGVLVSNDDKKKKKEETKAVNKIIKESDAPRRPKRLDCDVVRFMNKGESWIGFVGLLDDSPYEIFTGMEESFPIPNYVEKGIIEKYKNKETGEKRYDFVYKDKEGYKQKFNGLSRAFKKEFWDVAKMVSAVLRHGMPIPHVINLIDTLHLDGDFVGTWKSGVKRMLKGYIKDNVSLGEGKNICPECGEDSLVFQEGCIQCINPKCGYSKCS
jgi:ribonucleoside-diphosphate reductase alpha chain